MKIGIFSLTSPKNTREEFITSAMEFFNDLENEVSYELVHLGDDFARYGEFDMNLIFIRTGGTEALFRELYPSLHGPYYLLTSGRDNSLAASMEILSFLKSKGEEAEIIQGNIQSISSRIKVLTKVRFARRGLEGARYGVIGKPAKYLIASDYDENAIKDKLGIELVYIPAQEFLDETQRAWFPEHVRDYLRDDYDERILSRSLYSYGALTRIVEKYGLQGLTLSCFDVNGGCEGISCLPLSILNNEGVVAASEGDVPAIISMAILYALTGKSGFMANPAYIDRENNEITFAHCTVPINMVESYTYDTHFETAKGIAVKGIIAPGVATVFKTSGDLEKYFVTNGKIIKNGFSEHLCRTQVRIHQQKSVDYYLTNPIGNHHIISQGHIANLIEEFFRILNYPF